eukprot:gene1422-15844_t
MTMPPFAVRLATEEELPRAVDIVNEAFAAAYSHVRPPNAPPPRTTLEKVSIAMQQYDFESAGRSDTSSFGSLAVALDCQGRGVGRMLVEAAEAIAKSNGKKRMELSFGHGDLFSGRPSLSAFYAKLGYVEGERKARDAWFDVSPEYRKGLHFLQMVKML